MTAMMLAIASGAVLAAETHGLSKFGDLKYPAGFKHWRLDGYYRHAILAAVIVGFACKKTQRLWARERGHGLPPSIESVALRKLTQLHRSRSLSDLRVPPGNRLEPLKADRKGQHSIRVNDQWRVCFRWLGEDAHDVGIVDYH